MDLETTQALIAKKCDEIKELLLSKNLRYGASAFEPRRTFARSDTAEQLRVRIDDKLNRIQNSGESDTDEDTLLDLLGYLVIYAIVLDVNKKIEVPSGKFSTQNVNPSVTMTTSGSCKPNYIVKYT